MRGNKVQNACDYTQFGKIMPRPEQGAQAKEVLRMIEDFRARREVFFSRGYLNSDGRRAFIRLLRAGLQITYDLKGFAAKRYRRGSELDIDAVLREMENRFCTDTGSFKYTPKGKTRTHE